MGENSKSEKKNTKSGTRKHMNGRKKIWGTIAALI